MSPEFDEERLQRMLDGDLPPAEATSLRQAVAQDADASAQLARLERMGGLLRAAGQQWQSEVDSEGLFARIEAGIAANAAETAAHPEQAGRQAEPDAPAAAQPPQGNVIQFDRAAKKRRSQIWVPAAGAVALAAAVLLTVFRPVSPEELGGASEAPTQAPQEQEPQGLATASGEPSPVESNTPAQASSPAQAAVAPTRSDVVQVDFGEHAGAVFDVELAGGASTPVIWINE